MQYDTSDDALDYALNGLLAHIDYGSSNPKIQLWSATKPSPGAAVTSQVKIAEFLLTDPAGGVDTHVLSLTATGPALVLNSGTPTWGRIINGNGDWHSDADVGDEASDAVIKISSTTLFAGGEVTLVSADISF